MSDSAAIRVWQSWRVPDAVIFDLDGLLLESEQVWNAAKRELVEERGGEWTGAADRAMLGMSAPEWSRYMADELRVPLEPDDISVAVVELLTERYRRELPLLDGAGEAVRRLADRWPLGLASSSNREIINLVLERTRWAELFRVTVASEEVERGKPAPDVYLAAARGLGVAPGRCVAVEDSANGIRSAHAAGAAVVAIPNRAYPPDGEALGLAAVLLDSLADLDARVVAAA
jgi:HAD superfamily hydrolase (TIGR01509 family)